MFPSGSSTDALIPEPPTSTASVITGVGRRGRLRVRADADAARRLAAGVPSLVVGIGAMVEAVTAPQPARPPRELPALDGGEPLELTIADDSDHADVVVGSMTFDGAEAEAVT